MYAKFWKRLFDFFLSLIALAALSPLLLVLTVVGAIAMKGNPFFVQPRPGMIDKRSGKERIFNLIKFRTMSNAKDADGNLLPDAERLNGYGSFLRKTSLDELPSLINILKADIALVGPRPLLVKYLPRYSPEQRHRHDVRPGMTGYAQVHGRNAISWEDKFAMDVWYTQHVSLATDIKVLFDTVRVVIKHEGISSGTSVTMEEFMGSDENAKVTWTAPSPDR